jgi:hypothetical protein
VQWATKFSIPFVTRSGGHSEWSTIGKSGIIIDLSRYSGIDVNMHCHTATLRGSILSKRLRSVLQRRECLLVRNCTYWVYSAAAASTDPAGLFRYTRRQDADSVFAALGNGNTVGAIPYFLGGGASIASSVTGFGSDQIVSARLISAKGDLLDVTEVTNPDLLWAIRGAGQFFGLVTQLVIEAQLLSVLGNDLVVLWAGTFVFPLDRAEEVCSKMRV